MTFSTFFARSLLPVVMLALLASTTPAKTDGLKRLLRGAAGAIILNEIIRQESNSNPRGTVARPSTNTVKIQGPHYSRAEKREIQNALNILGFGAGSVDGAFGGQTRAAIRNFQSEHAFPVTGVLKRDQFAAIRSMASTQAGAVPNSERALGSGEVKQLQKALKSLGYYSGKIDGQAGRGTAGAVSRFLLDRGHEPNSTPVVLALSLAAAEAGQQLPNYLLTEATALGGNGQTVAAVSVDTDAYEHILHNTTSMTSLRKALYLHAIKAYPDILDDETFIDREASGYKDVFEYKIAGYGRMNQFETENGLDGLRERIRAEAEAMAPLSDDKPWRLAFYTPIGVKEFDDGAGLILGHGQNSFPYLPKRGRKDTFGLEISYSEPPQPGSIGIAREQAEAMWKQIDAAREKRPKEWTYIVTYVTIKSIGLKKASVAQQVNNIGSSTIEIVMNTDAIELHTAEERKPARGEPLYKWELGPSRSGATNGSVLAWGRSKGFSVVAGHLVTGSGTGKTNTLRYKMRLNLEPEIAREGQNFETIAASLMNGEQEKAFFGRTVYSDGYPSGVNHNQSKFSDEFARREAKQIFFDSHFDRLRKIDPPWPLPFVQIIKTYVGEYDFDNEKFDLFRNTFRSPDYSTLTPAALLEYKTLAPPVLGDGDHLTWVGNWIIPNLPIQLSAGFEEGRAISSKISKRRSREVYLGVFYTVGAPKLVDLERGKRMVSSSKPVRMALFYDPELTEIIREFDMDEVLARPVVEVAKVEPEPETQKPEVERILNEEHFPTKSDLWAYMYQMHPKLANTILAKSRRLESANEFERDEVRSQLEAQLQIPVAKEGWMQITLRFGTYDFERGTLPITEYGIGVGPSNWKKFRGYFDVQFPDDALSTAVELPRDIAEKIANMRNREVNAIARGHLQPGTIDISDNRQRTMTLLPTFVPEEILLIEKGWASDSIPTLLHRITLNAAPEKVATVAPEETPEQAPVHKINVTSSQDLLGLKLGGDFEALRETLETKRTILGRYGASNERALFEVIVVSEDEAFTFIEPHDAKGTIGIVRVVSRNTGFDPDKLKTALVKKYGTYTVETDKPNGGGDLVWQVSQAGVTCAQADVIYEGNASLALQHIDQTLNRTGPGITESARHSLFMAMAVEKLLFETETANDCETVFQATLDGALDADPTQLATMLYSPAAAKELKEARTTTLAATKVEEEEVEF